MIEKKPILASRCVSCKVLEGELHRHGCPDEICGICGGLRLLCGHEGAKGRIPFIRYPRERFCGICGERRPKGFHVSDKEWRATVPPSRRRDYLCRDCYNRLRRLVDSKT